MSSRALYSPIITVYVGPTRQEFCIHKDILCHNSRYFAKALTGQFLEAQTRKVHLEDVHTILFKVFVAWLYTGKLTYESSNPDVSSHDDMEKFDKAPQEEHPYEVDDGDDDKDDEDWLENDLSAFDREVPQTWTHLILAADCARFKRQIIDTMVEREQDILPSDSAILFAYANTTRNSPLRRLFVHFFAYEARFRKHYTEWTHLPVDHLAAVMVAMGRRPPARQCSSCYERALGASNITPDKIDDLNEEEDQPPFKRNLCFYHEHNDTEEEEACRMARKQ